MRTSGIITAAFAAAAIAVPLADKREVDVVTDIDVVYVTDVVTETVGAGYQTTAVVASSVATSAVAAPSSASSIFHWGHWSHHHRHSTSSKKASSSAAPTSAAPPAPVTSSEAPAPTTTSVYVPPPSTSSEAAPTTEAPAPSTTEAPSSYAQPTTAKPSSSAAATTAAAAAPAVSPYGGSSGDANYKAAVANHHNLHRSNHSAPAIEWDDNLASIAASIAATCVYAHNVTAGGGGYGQNIAAGVTSDSISEVISNMFYNGEVNWYNGLYGQANPDMTNFEHWGHFSQIVWKGTTKVGCWTHDCGTGNLANVQSNVPAVFTVCNYSPPGNYGGEYGDNIGASKNQASVQGSKQQ